jgi:hypothetical protein
MTTVSSSANDIDTAAWAAHLKLLQSRFPNTKPQILFAARAIEQTPDVNLDALKEQADHYGLRVTGATLKAARRLLDPAAAEVPATEGSVDGATAVAVAAPARRRGRRADPSSTVEDLLRKAVGQIEARAAGELNRVRNSVRKALAALQEALQ